MRTEELIRALEFASMGPAHAGGVDLRERPAPELFQFGDEACSYSAWKGESIDGEFIAVDTETVFIGERLERGEVPELVLVSASGTGAADNYIVQPRDLARFIERHRDRQLVFFNIGFDFPVMLKSLAEQGEDAIAEDLWQMLDEGSCHDLMLLDQLVRLAEGRGPYHRRSLADVAAETLGIELEKEDSPRKHYRLVLEAGYRNVDPAFYEYAVMDSRSTLKAFERVWQRAWELHRAHQESVVDPADPRRAQPWAPLTEGIQVRGAVALARMASRGVAVDCNLLGALIVTAEARMEEAVGSFASDATVRRFQAEEGQEILKRNEDGELLLTEKQLPRKGLKLLREFFLKLCRQHGDHVPRTPKGLVSLGHDDYIGTKAYDEEPALGKYFAMQEAASHLVKLRNIRDHVNPAGEVHPQYVTLVKTGRATCHNPQIQNLEREGSARNVFVPRPGFRFYAADYKAIELAALASVCQHRYGRSSLGDRIRANEDPHTFTASKILGKSVADVSREERQAAKVYNFGVPGGMGAAALARQARVAYRLEMTEEEAARWREQLIREVYPEIGIFLNDGLADLVSERLGVDADQIVDALIETTGADEFSDDARSWILGHVERFLRRGCKRNGDPYSPNWEERVWRGLEKVYALSQSARGRDEEVERILRLRATGRAAARAFFPTRAVTLTGRVWSGVTYCQGHNAEFQGPAADGAKLALYRLEKEGYRPVIFVHDEVVVEVPEDGRAEHVARRIDEIMVTEMQRVIPDVAIRVEGKFAKRWEK